jgi:multidrug resistance efflux pump
MLELMFSALITILPDFLYRRYRQGKRLGHEITLFSAWYELRWGITACAILATILLTVIFYYHPTATNVTSLFRTVTILSDTGGRVEEVYVRNNQYVYEGEPIFRLETSRQQAAVKTAYRGIAEVDAALVMASAELDVAQGNIHAAEAALRGVQDELVRQQQAQQRNNSVVSEREIAALQANVDSRKGALEANLASRFVIQTRIDSVLPAQRESSVSILAQAQTEIENATVYAGTNGTVQQFKLKPGDIVNPILRPAGILVPSSSGRGRFQAGFRQISAPVLKVGMLAEITCASKSLMVIPMVVIEIQDSIASGQLRPTDQLIDIQDRMRPGTIMAVLEPVFEGHTDDIIPGSTCLGVAYTSRAAERESGEITGFGGFTSTIVDGMGIANALVIRIQAIMLPIRVLVFPG